MGKALSSLQELTTRLITSNRLQGPTHKLRPVSRATSTSEPAKVSSGGGVLPGLAHQQQLKRKKMGENSDQQRETRVPLSKVVNDCVKRWFQDTLKEAKAGDSGMQVLVGQMYYSGYGVPMDTQKGRAWINRASKTRSSALKVGDKHPGYNASDSDSDVTKGDAK